MKIPEPNTAGTWTGKLIDVRGYEGEIVLRLEGDPEKLYGKIDATIGATHVSQRQTVVVSGEYRDGDLWLKGIVDPEAGVEIAIEARIFEIFGGGFGLRGTYQVAARQFSPLRAGVISASRGERLTAVEVREEVTVVREEPKGALA